MAARTKHRILLWSGHRVAGCPTDYRIELNPGISNVVFAEWAASSVAGYVLDVEELQRGGLTTNERRYWRFVASLTNSAEPPLPESETHPRPVRTLTVHWRNPDGSVPTNLPEHALELDLWQAGI